MRGVGVGAVLRLLIGVKVFDTVLLEDILQRHGLEDKWKQLKLASPVLRDHSLMHKNFIRPATSGSFEYGECHTFLQLKPGFLELSVYLCTLQVLPAAFVSKYGVHRNS